MVEEEQGRVRRVQKIIRVPRIKYIIIYNEQLPEEHHKTRHTGRREKHLLQKTPNTTSTSPPPRKRVQQQHLVQR